jgi:hypothetical protein
MTAAETAGPSTALRSGRDDNSVSGRNRCTGTVSDPCNRIVIPTGAYPDFLLRAASDNHVCGSPQRELYALPQRHRSPQEIRGSVVEGPAVSPLPTHNSNLSHPSPLVIPTGGIMGLRPTQEDEKHADQEDPFPPFRTKNKKLWVPHISRSEMWEGCPTAVG